MKIADILNNIDNKSLALPVFQRGYVWKRRQVKDLMNSLYHGYPVGALLTWTTRAELVPTRGNSQERNAAAIDLLLDGQQRITSLYGVMRGSPPIFFDGDAGAFMGLYFNLDSEEFEFLSRTRATSDPLWVDVTELFNDGSSWMSALIGNPAYANNLDRYLQRGLDVRQIRDTDLPVQQITGDDKTTDIVVDIFNRVNSGGTKLSKGDLALARIGGSWPAVREEMQRRLAKWERAGFTASLDWLLRCMNAIITGNSEFERLELDRVGIQSIQQSLEHADNAVDHLLEAMRSHLHMDIDRVYSSKQAFPVMVKYLVDHGGSFPDLATTARLLHWYVSVAIWGRFSGPTETTINQDLVALEEPDPIEALLRNLRVSQGERSIAHENFDLPYTTARFYPLLYVLSRIQDARDWGTGNRIRHHSLGDDTNLELHHIFPKAYLRRNGVSAKDANNMGNIAFQTRETNRSIGSSPPSEYMPSIARNWPGALESQWVPTDPELWQVEHYHLFLEARRRLLAEAANAMLQTLQSGIIPPSEVHAHKPVAPVTLEIPALEIDPDDEARILWGANQFALEHGLPAGETAYEVYGDDNAEIRTVLDLAWPDGLQPGFSQPVALLIDEDDSTIRNASDAGFKVFTTLPGFQRYVEREILAETA